LRGKYSHAGRLGSRLAQRLDAPPHSTEFRRSLRKLNLFSTPTGAAMSHDRPTTIRVVIADDHAMFRHALRLVLEMEHDFAVVGEARDGLEAVEQVVVTRPDLLLLDVAMPRATGLDALRQLSGGPSVGTVLLTAAITSPEVATAIKLGARGILLKDETSTVLLQCLRMVARGGIWMDKTHVDQLAQMLFTQPEAPSRAPIETLTRRELDVIAAVVEGGTNRDIGLALRLSQQTVKNHLSHIYDKLGVSSRLELALHATHHRLAGSGALRTPAPANA